MRLPTESCMQVSYSIITCEGRPSHMLTGDGRLLKTETCVTRVLHLMTSVNEVL